ncbi:MAG: M14 family metallopeptidase, partial [Planctomycetota bacterium]
MIFRICNGVVVYLLLLASTSVAFDEPQQENLTPLTVAEASHFKSTSSSQEVIEFLEEVATVDHISTFEFGRTVENRPMTGIAMSKQPYQLGNSDDRLVILVLGNIHSGECAGKEALLMMARELRDEAEHRWLKKAVVLFVPNYNADANDRVGKGNRPGQIGPENGMGRRENAQNLDLNRDFIKLESPEARALVQLIDKTNPHLFIDCHTTNGSKHRYALTYDIPHNPSTAEPIRSFLRHKMMPEVTKRLEKSGTDTFYYGNFSDDHTRWTTFGHEPRYSTEYVGLRGRLAILSEAYSYIPYKDRVFATKDFVSACLDYVTENSNSIQMLLNSVDQDLARLASTQPSRISMSLDARVEKFNEKFVLKGYKHEQPFDYECDFIGKYVPTVTTPLPFAYVIPGNLIRPVDRLLMHGIEVGRLTTSIDCDVNVDTVKSMNRNERVFQKHKMLRAESQQETNKRQIPKGSFIVRTAQPLGRLAAYLLECQSNDGLV